VENKLDECGKGRGEGKDGLPPDSPTGDPLCAPQDASACEALRDCTACDALRVDALLSSSRDESKLFGAYKDWVLDVDYTVAACECDAVLAQPEACTPILDNASSTADPAAQGALLDELEVCLSDLFTVLNACSYRGRRD
jgi:hypothetical protein